jgi:hypothetical protein
MMLRYSQPSWTPTWIMLCHISNRTRKPSTDMLADRRCLPMPIHLDTEKYFITGCPLIVTRIDDYPLHAWSGTGQMLFNRSSYNLADRFSIVCILLPFTVDTHRKSTFKMCYCAANYIIHVWVCPVIADVDFHSHADTLRSLK